MGFSHTICKELRAEFSQPSARSFAHRIPHEITKASFMREALRHLPLENQMSHASHSSHTSHLAIGKARSPMPRPAECKLRSSVKWVCVLRIVEHLPLLFSIQLSKIKLGLSLCHFAGAKHTFKASVACNGREVLHGKPGSRHGISAREAADCHWQSRAVNR